MAGVVVACGINPCFADGVVIESTAVDYPRGRIVAAGEQIELQPGEHLSILDQSGDVFRFDTSTLYDSEPRRDEAEQAEAPTLLELATWDSQRPDIGGTRDKNLQHCLAEAAKRNELDERDCHAAFEAPASFDFAFASGATSLGAGDPLVLKLRPSFDASISCTVSGDSDGASAAQIDFGRTRGAWLRVPADVTAMVPRRGMRPLSAPEEAGSHAITCIAVDRRTVEIFLAEVGDVEDEALRREMLSSFAAIRGADWVQEQLSFSVSSR